MRIPIIPFIALIALIVLGFGVMTTQTGCERLGRSVLADSILAQVGSETLSKKQLSALLPTQEFEQTHAQQLIKQWVVEQVLYQEHAATLSLETAQTIEAKTTAYKRRLVAHALEVEYVEQNLDSVIQESEIEAYYQQNINNFTLYSPIIQGRLVRVHNKAPAVDSVRVDWINSQNTQRVRPFTKNYCVNTPQACLLKDTTWVEASQLLGYFEKNTRKNIAKQIEKPIEIEYKLHPFVYYVSIHATKSSGTAPPLDYVRDRLTHTLLGMRKQVLITSFHQYVWEQAQKSDGFKINQ